MHMKKTLGIAVNIHAPGRVVSTHVAADNNRQSAIEAALVSVVESERAAVRKLIGSIAEPGRGELDAGGYLFSCNARLQGKVTAYNGAITISPCEICS